MIADGVDGLNHAGHMVAGAFAGAAEHVFMFPIDTVKTRMQVRHFPEASLACKAHDASFS